MLNDYLDVDSVLDFRLSKLPAFCEDLVDSISLEEGLDQRSLFSRKTLCEFLGIGESTLSGWLKGDRIPQMAKITLVLLEANRVLRDEIIRLRDEMADLKVVRRGQQFAVCEFLTDQEGETIGRVIADQIDDIEDARLLAGSRRALRLLEKAEPMLAYVEDNCTNALFVDEARSQAAEHQKHILFATDYEEWKREFGRQTSAERIRREVAEMFGNGPNAGENGESDSGGEGSKL